MRELDENPETQEIKKTEISTAKINVSSFLEMLKQIRYINTHKDRQIDINRYIMHKQIRRQIYILYIDRQKDRYADRQIDMQIVDR